MASQELSAHLLGAFCWQHWPKWRLRVVGILALIGASLSAMPAAANAASWSIQRTPSPIGAENSSLTGVSCSSNMACTAVGDYTNSTGESVTLAERWNGTTWAIQTTPNPAGAQDSYLNSVSCTSPVACTAVGYYVSAGNYLTFAERWNGARWSVQSTPSPSPLELDSSLSSVACTAPATCTAVGVDYISGAGSGLAERWNGTSWTVQTIQNPVASSATWLSGVTCTSSTACTAVGAYFSTAWYMDMALAEGWNGASWTIQGTPIYTAYHNFNSVSCMSSASCIGVGDVFGANTSGPMAEIGNRGSWTWQSVPQATHPSGFNGVSCKSTICIAVGASGTMTLSERWNGTSWVIQSTPNPAGSFNSLRGVSCTSPSKCTAVGGAGSGTLAERYS